MMRVLPAFAREHLSAGSFYQAGYPSCACELLSRSRPASISQHGPVRRVVSLEGPHGFPKMDVGDPSRQQTASIRGKVS